MKKLILSVAMLAAGAAAFAQKPAAGNITTEIGLSSLLGTPANPTTLNIPVGMFRFRYFLSEGLAVRANLGFGTATEKENIDNAPITPLITGEITTKVTNFGIALGIEKHLEGTEKLSPYIGAEFGFSSQTGSIEATNSANGTTITASGDSYKTSGGGVTSIAFNAMIGADYYITDRVYFGAELGLGLFASESQADSEVTSSTGGTSTTVKTLGSSTSGFGFLPQTIGQIRLGIILF
jgi:hypothetical protein